MDWAGKEAVNKCVQPPQLLPWGKLLRVKSTLLHQGGDSLQNVGAEAVSPLSPAPSCEREKPAQHSTERWSVSDNWSFLLPWRVAHRGPASDSKGVEGKPV